MPFIYNLIIEQTEKEDIFHITWHNTETNTQDSFTQPVEMASEEIRSFRHQPQHHLDIGQKLFYFLDGDSRYFLRVLDQAKQQGQSIQVNLHPCQKVADWPFELLAINNTFLLPHQLHLVRCVSDWGRAKSMTPQNRPLKLLFTACSPMDVKPELDFEREEEAIFHITEKLEIDIEVEYSGSLQGLHNQLQQGQYDVVHLSGYVNIDQNGPPYFIMEDEIGCKHRVFPENLWEEALIENPPHLLFLSGIRPDDALYSPESSTSLSLGQRLAKSHPLSTVLEWDRPARDEQVIHAGKIFYRQLSRGRSILEAIQRMRYELLKNFSETTNPAWPMLRLFSTGMELNALVKENQQWQPKSRRMKHIYLKYSQAQVLIEGFVGRRRQLQNSLRTLKNNIDKLGVLILGDAGVGKSSLAGKICEQFTNHTIIIVHGKLNTITLEAALKDAFIISQDEEGQKILSQKREMTKKLPDLMATSFIKKNYLLLLDDFDKNLEGTDKGQPGLLTLEAAELLKILLQYLHISGKMTQLIITSRCEFSLTHEDRDLVKERLEKIWLTNFNESEQQKKARQLEHIINYPDQSVVPRLLTAGHGNPRLMEWLDSLVGEMEKAEVTDLLEAVKKKQKEFFKEYFTRVPIPQDEMSAKTEKYKEEFSSVKEIPREEAGEKNIIEEKTIKNSWYSASFFHQVNKVICLVKGILDDKTPVLLNYVSPESSGMSRFIDIKLPDNEKEDHKIIKTLLSQRLTIPDDQIDLDFNRSSKYLITSTVKKTADEEKALKYGPQTRYNYYYCKVIIDNPPQYITQPYFKIKDVQYHWLSINSLKSNPGSGEYNFNILEFLSEEFDQTLILLPSSIPIPIQNIMPNVFIAYAKEDFDRVKFLADFLKGQGINVFIDKEFLKIGEDFESSIQNKIQVESDFFLICLSKIAVSKKGTIHKEIRQACEIRDMLPDQKEFILPVKLDDCIVPQKIAKLHYKDWFSNSDTETLYDIAANIKDHFKPDSGNQLFIAGIINR